MKVWLIKNAFRSKYTYNNKSEISTSADITYLYLIIVFALTFSAKVMETNLKNITWNVRRDNIIVSLHVQHIRKA